MNDENKGMVYTFSEDDMMLLVDRLEYVKDLIYVIDSVYGDDIPEEIIDATNDADDALIRIQALISSKINNN